MTDLLPSSLEDEDMYDYDLLKDKTKKLKLKSETDETEKSSRIETADEFLRNFMIKFGMTATLESFQNEFYEKKNNNYFAEMHDKASSSNAKEGVMDDEIPEVYSKNLELSDEIALLQELLDEARITSEKARSTYDKLIKQRDYQKINHRRVQQEKSTLNKEINHLKKIYEVNQFKFKELTQKYENIMKEKMIMKLEKERLNAKVENLEKSFAQIIDEGSDEELKDKTQLKSKLDGSVMKKKEKRFQSGEPSEIPQYDPENPALSEINEIMSATPTLLKTFKGHLMGVTGLSYNPNKHILATSSDDSTWKLWSIPNGELIMSGEGHQDWLGDC